MRRKGCSRGWSACTPGAGGPEPFEGRRRWLGAALGGAALLAGCVRWAPPATPMPTRQLAAPCPPAAARCVLLPGALSTAEEFVREGFVADVQAACPACEVTLAEAHIGYFVEGALLPRLREDVVRPASGGPRPWLVGTSLGALAALAYAAEHGNEIAGVVAIAPYLGRRELLRDISAAGGPEGFARLPAREPTWYDAHETLEEQVWRWLATAPRGAPQPGPPIYLGYGTGDRFADAQRVLQSLLPAAHTHSVAGGHDWPPWRMLWRQWLQRGLLPARGVAC